MKILVTGASGHLGYHICKILTTEYSDYTVRAFVRKSSYREHLKALPVTVYEGDVLDVDSLIRATENMEAVFHTAAVYRMTENKGEGESVDPIIETSMSGTENLYRAARENHIKKIVYTSSVAAVGTTKDKTVRLDESAFAADGHIDYYRAKIESEKLAHRCAETYNIPTVVCNPATIVGKDDFKLTPSNRMLLDMAANSRFYVDGGQCPVDVADVARGHILALQKGRDGNRYILSGDNTELKDLTVLIRDSLNIKGLLIKLNKWVLYSAAVIFEGLGKLPGVEPILTREKVSRAVGNYTYYDCSKAKKELGYDPKAIAETLPATLTWLLDRYR